MLHKFTRVNLCNIFLAKKVCTIKIALTRLVNAIMNRTSCASLDYSFNPLATLQFVTRRLPSEANRERDSPILLYALTFSATPST